MHLGVGGVGDGVAAELDSGAGDILVDALDGLVWMILESCCSTGILEGALTSS